MENKDCSAAMMKSEIGTFTMDKLESMHAHAGKLAAKLNASAAAATG